MVYNKKSNIKKNSNLVIQYIKETDKLKKYMTRYEKKYLIDIMYKPISNQNVDSTYWSFQGAYCLSNYLLNKVRKRYELISNYGKSL